MKTNRNTTKTRGGAGKRTKQANVQPFTEFEGESYTGLRTTQAWSLGKGSWEEQRTGAQSWEVAFETIAMKPGKNAAGLPIGSEHHSYILAHQKLVKTRNNTYRVRIEGVKFKLAHREAEGRWSANAAVRKKNLINILRQVLHDLEMGHGQAPSQTRPAPQAADTGAVAGRPSRARKKGPKD